MPYLLWPVIWAVNRDIWRQSKKLMTTRYQQGLLVRVNESSGRSLHFSDSETLKSDLPQRHRGHRENLFIVNSADGAVNNKTLCPLCLCGKKFVTLF